MLVVVWSHARMRWHLGRPVRALLPHRLHAWTYPNARKESLRSCHRAAAARRTAARTSAAILAVKGAVLRARARESWPDTVSSGTGIRRSRGAGIGKDGYKAGILEEGLDRRTVEAFLTHHIDRVEEGVENPDA